MSNDDPFLDLVWRAYAGEIDDAQSVELAALLEADAEKQQEYVDYMLLYTGIRWQRSEGALLDEIQSLVDERSKVEEATEARRACESKRGSRATEESEPNAVAKSRSDERARAVVEEKEVEEEVAGTALTRSKSFLNWASRHPRVPAIAVASTVLIAALVVMGLVPVTEWVAGGGKAKLEERESGEKRFVAKLSNWHNDVWLEGNRPPLDDPRLKIGRKLVLRSGVIEVTYLTGARVVIEGPAEFTIGTKAEGLEAQREAARSASPHPSNAGYLKLGSLVARVQGKKSQGFAIDTPSARIEDLGTEFGVEVDRSGAAEVAVLSGEVDIIRESSSGVVAERIRLTKDQGAFVASRGSAIRRRSRVDASRIEAMSLLLSQSFDAGIVKLAQYRMGEQGSYSRTSPFILDSLGTPNNVTSEQVAVVSTSVDRENFAPANSSTASLSKVGGGGVDGFFTNSNPFGLTSNFVMDIWARPARLDGGEVMGSTNGPVNGVTIGHDGRHWLVRGTNGPTRSTLIITNSPATIGVWARLTLISYGNKLHFYVNAKNVGSATTIPRVLDQPMFFFGSGGAAPGSFGGNLDEAGIWSFDHTSHTLEEVEQAVFETTKPREIRQQEENP